MSAEGEGTKAGPKPRIEKAVADALTRLRCESWRQPKAKGELMRNESCREDALLVEKALVAALYSTPDPATQRVLEAAKDFLDGLDPEGMYDVGHLKALREAVEALAGREK